MAHKRKFTLKVPCPVRSKSKLNTSPIPSKGVCGDTLTNTILKGADKSIATGKEIGNTATWTMELQLLSENINMATEPSVIREAQKAFTMNESIADTIGIDLLISW